MSEGRCKHCIFTLSRGGMGNPMDPKSQGWHFLILSLGSVSGNMTFNNTLPKECIRIYYTQGWSFLIHSLVPGWVLEKNLPPKIMFSIQYYPAARKHHDPGPCAVWLHNVAAMNKTSSQKLGRCASRRVRSVWKSLG